MLTPGVDEVGGEPGGLWVSLTELARMRGVSKQAVAKRVDRLVSAGMISSRLGDRGSKLVNVAEFDRVVGETTDAVRTANGLLALAAPGEGDPILAKEQARNAAYSADLKKLELDERLGHLLPIKDVEEAMMRCAAAMVRVIDQLPAQAEDNAAAVARAGVLGSREWLRGAARTLRDRLAREMRLQSAPALQADADADA